MRDFTIIQYIKLLKVLKNNGYSFQTFNEYLYAPKPKVFILRHDVDDKKMNALQFSRIESQLGIRGSYYFRAVRLSWDDNVIKEIHKLNHEIGYHYESLTTYRGNLEKAFEDFKTNLERLRKLAPVSTICMHGSPRSRWDSRDIWAKYDYRQLGIVGEPYFDIDFNVMFYLTDTGRQWDGMKVSVRDQIPQQEQWTKNGLVFHSTKDIIYAAEQGTLPEKIMITFHPQRWNDNYFFWAKELLLQNIKNQIKKFYKK